MDGIFDSPTVLAIIAFAAIAFMIISLIAARFKVAKPNEAFIITGRKGKKAAELAMQADLSGQKVVLGGGVFIVPLVQKLHVLDLSARRISITIRQAVSLEGIRLNLDAVAVVKVGSDGDSIRSAGQRFLSQQSEIDTFTTEVLAGALRAIVGTLSVEEIIRDRAAFASSVAVEAESSLTSQGLSLDTFQIQDIADDGNYIQDLGRGEEARIAKDAAVAEAQRHRESAEAELQAEEKIAEARRDLALKQASILAETDAAAATAAASGPLEQAAQQQEVLTAQERVAERQAALKERELDTEVRKPADAARYEVEIRAEAARTAKVATADADRTAAIAGAEARARAAELTGAGERDQRVALADAAQREAEVAAKAVQLAGEAEASAIGATGAAEAEAMQKKADAFKSYESAATLQMFMEVLPKIAAEIAAPMASIDDLTVLSTEGAGALPKTVVNTMAQTTEMLKSATGIDIAQLLPQTTDSAATPEALEEPTSDK
ncbi:MAG: flotillin [Actinomycetes bacterium]|jgi:flotillin